MNQTLATYIAEWDRFDWETDNCAHFALRWGCPKALDGVPMPGSRSGVRGTLRSLGARSLREAVGRRVGEEINPKLAKIGDIVLSGNTLGICAGRVFAAPFERAGIVFQPMAEVDAAWRRAPCAG